MKFWIALTMLILACFFLFLDPVTPVNLNGESISIPMSIAYLQHPDMPMWQNFKDQDFMAHEAPGHHFHGEWPVLSSPFIMACYYPFVKMYGIQPLTCGAYSTFYSLLALVLTYILALKMFNRWTALLSCLFMISSLSWLIHTKACVQQAMPSVCLMIGIAYCSWKHLQRWSPKILILWGILLSFCYLTGWIVFPMATILTALALIIASWKDRASMSLTAIIAGFWFVVGMLGFTVVYSWLTGLKFSNIHVCIWQSFTHRFNQGSVPSHQDLSIIEKAWYAIKLTFIDMTAFDHPDKYADGLPAIPILFTVLFFIGLWHIRKELVLCLWFISTYGIMVTIYLFSGRYSLLAIPAIAMVAACGVIRGLKWVPNPQLAQILFSILMALTIVLTIGQYEEFKYNSKPNYERDRQRGHYEFSKWLKTRSDPEDTLVVLNDPINLSGWQLMFNTFDKPYSFVYWNRYFNARSTARDVKIWEKKLINYKKIVYVFACTVIGDPPTNDWSAFIGLRKDATIDFRYNYNGKILFVAVIVKND